MKGLEKDDRTKKKQKTKTKTKAKTKRNRLLRHHMVSGSRCPIDLYNYTGDDAFAQKKKEKKKKKKK